MAAERKYSFNDIMQIDQWLMQFASYEASKGFLKIPTSMEDMVELQKQTSNNFRYFKRLIQTNECTLEDIEQMVIKRHGAVPLSNKTKTISQALSEICNKQQGDDKDATEIEKSILLALTESFKNYLPEGMVIVPVKPVLPKENNSTENKTNRTKKAINGKSVKPKTKKGKSNT
jgi:hypothetical protein